MASLDAFKTALIGGGARANQFKVQLTFPIVAASATAGLAAPFLIKAASLPEISIGTAQVVYLGRILPLAGERQFQPWSVNVYNDNNFLIRNAMEKWSNAMNDFANNTGVTSPLAYKADATVQQLDRNGALLKQYKFIGMFPTHVSAIGLDFGQNDQIEEFSITFAYDHYETDMSGSLISGGINIGGVGISI